MRTRESTRQRPYLGNVGTVLRVVGAALAVAIVLAACGDADSRSESAEAATSTTESTSSTAPRTATTSDAESASPEDDPEFIDLEYWEGFFAEGIEITVQPREECDEPSTDVIVCSWAVTGSMVGTHIGRATEEQAGTSTLHLDEPCTLADGTSGWVKIDKSSGTITTAWGDELYFNNQQYSCLPDNGEPPETQRPSVAGLNITNNWAVTGGTGLFADASGLMSGVSPVLESGFGAVTTGTLTVRADLWEDRLPGHDEATPGA